MPILLFFAFVSGLLTILAPCIWPLLPIVLSFSTTGGRAKSLGIALGVTTSFALFTLSISYLVMLFHFDPNYLRLFAIIIIALLGLTLIIPSLSARLEAFVSRLSGKISPSTSHQGFFSGFLSGFILGIIWSPCAGPILATIATLSATLAVSSQLILVTLFYAAGLAIPLFIFSLGSQTLFTKTHFLNRYLGRIQQAFGVVMILTALVIYTNYDKVIQAKILESVPSYSNFLTSFENNSQVKKELNALKSTQDTMSDKAPEFTGITNWLNSPPLTMAQLQGKVVLVDFWTYTCINCIRTLPHVTSWYDKYKDKGLVIVGVHTPEFEFEKKTENVLAAIKQHNIKYPVAQDNAYATWNAYANRYWPAKYLINKEGRIVYTHFGEGSYEETEKKIQELLGLNMPVGPLADLTPQTRLTPELYLGSARANYRSPSPNPSLNLFYLGGSWTIDDEYAMSGENAYLELNFFAGKVFLVMRPPAGGQARVRVTLDGQEINTLTVDSDKLYQLVDLPETGTHLLRLEFLTPGIQLYAFTFG